jgi:hypothetical protein
MAARRLARARSAVALFELTIMYAPDARANSAMAGRTAPPGFISAIIFARCMSGVLT